MAASSGATTWAKKQFKRRRKAANCGHEKRVNMIEAFEGAVILDEAPDEDQLAPLVASAGQPNAGHQRQAARGSSGNKTGAFLKLALINLIWTLTLTSCKFQPSAGSTLSDFDGATFYKATQGSRIRIACNATNWQDDSVSLILWFKGSLGASSSSASSSLSSSAPASGRAQSSQANQNNNYNGQPIYTIDARQRSLTSGQARHLVADAYRGRAKFVIPSGGGGGGGSKLANNQSAAAPYLDLAPLEADDQGEFRCRVDYRSRPRENFLMILFVLVPPSKVEIMDSNGRSLEQIYGPLNESSDLTLLCASKGGRPPPALSWASGATGKVIDESYLTISDYLALQMSAGHQRRASYIVGASGGLPPMANGNANSTGQQQQQEKLFSLLSEAAARASSSELWRQPNSGAADKNLSRRAGQPDSINSYVGSPATTTTVEEEEQHSSLAAEWDWRDQWSVWPEFDYFGRSLSSSGDEAAEVGSVGEQQGRGGEQKVSQSSAVELLDLKVDPTITTSVNVLHINELSRELYTSLTSDHNNGLDLAGQPSGGLAAGAQLAKLECRASNLHYDLRSLIKMFAPPSLVGEQVGGEQRPRPHGPLLVGAIQRALEASTRLEANSSGDQQQQQQWLEHQHQHQKTAHMSSQPLVSQIKVDSSGGASPAGGPSAAAAAAAQAQSGWPNVIYQQLVRPHQLSSAAAGSGHREPLVQSRLIALDAYLRPLDVKLLVGSQRPLAASGQPSEFTCTSAGSRPPARLSWLKNGRPLEPKLSRQVVDTVNGTTLTTSKLLVKLERDDHGAQLTCRAQNPKVGAADGDEHDKQGRRQQNESSPMSTGWALEDSIVLSVQYQPKLKLELGNKMLSEQIREGSDIYFVCSVDAQPAISELSWLHDDRPLGEDTAQPAPPAPLAAAGGKQAPGSGAAGQLIMSNNSLVLQRVRIDQRGKYTCMASNSEGVSVSNSIELRVLHAPICVAQTTPTNSSSSSSSRGRDDQLLVQSLALPIKAQVNLDCLMSADPIDESLHFAWYLNNSHNERRLIFESSPTTNQLDAAPQPPMAAANRSGRQQQVARSVLRHYSIETSLDYGRLFCVASNAIGQQKRACVYQIEPSLEPMEAVQPTLEDFKCLAVNVTSGSVWIGCQLERPPPPPTRIKFQVLLQLKGGQQTVELVSDEFDAQQQEQEQMPSIFELNNLRPNSNYLLEISALNAFDGSRVSKMPHMVQFKTPQEQHNNDNLLLASASEQETESSGRQDKYPAAQIRTVSALSNHQSDLVASALQQISTRSANSRDLMGSSSSSSSSSTSADLSSHLQRHNTPKASIWTSLARLFSSRNPAMQSDSPEPPRAATRRPPQSVLSQKVAAGQPNPAASYSSTSASKLMDFASDSLLVGSMCLVLMVTLVGLLLIRRLAFRRRPASSKKPTSGGVRMNALSAGTQKATEQTYGSNESSSSNDEQEFELGPSSGKHDDHQVAEADCQSPGYSCSNSTMLLDYVDSLRTARQPLEEEQQHHQRRPPLDGQQLIGALSSRDMLATSSLQRRRQKPGGHTGPASVQLKRTLGVKNNTTSTANQNGQQLLNNNKAKNVGGELVAQSGASSGQVSGLVPRSRSSLSFGGSVASVAGAGQQAPRLIHLSGQQQPGEAPQQQQQQQQRLLISDANVAQAANEIDLSLAASVDGHGGATACWLAGPYIQLAATAGAAATPAESHLNSELQSNERYQIMLPAAAAAAVGRCHVRGQQQQQQQQLEATTSRARRALGQQQQQVAAVKLAGSCQSDGSDSSGRRAGGAVCSCDESHHSGHTSHPDNWPPMLAPSQQTGRPQRVGRRDFILANNNEINHDDNNNNYQRRHHSASLMSDESSDHSNQVATLAAGELGQANHHNHPPLYVRHHDHGHHHLGHHGQQQQLGFAGASNAFIQLIEGPAHLDPFTAGQDAFDLAPGPNEVGSDKQEARKLQLLTNVAHQEQHLLLSANLNNYNSNNNNNNNNHHQQQSLMSCSPSTTNTTNTTTTATSHNNSANHRLGSSPISIESSGATLSQDHPVDLLQQMGQPTGPVHCIDNESIDEQHGHSATTASNSRPLNGGQRGHLASILKNYQRAQGNLNNDNLNVNVNLNQAGQSASPAAGLNQFDNECQCNGNSNNNNHDSSTNL